MFSTGFLNRLALEKRALHEITGYWKVRSRLALDRLKDLLRQKRTIEALERIRKGNDLLKGLIHRRGRDVVDRLKKLGGKSLQSTLDRLVAASKFKQMAIFAGLQRLSHHRLIEKKTVEFASDVAELRKKGLAQLLAAALKKKMYQSLTELRLHNEEEGKLAERNRQLGARVMINLNERLKFLKNQTLAKLREFRQSQIDQLKRQQVAIGILAHANTRKQQSILTKLADNMHFSRKTDAQNKLAISRLLAKLASRSLAKCQFAIRNLRENKEELANRDRNLKNKLMNGLVLATQSVARQSLQRLRKNADDWRINQSKQDKLKASLRILAEGPRANLAGALQMLRNNSKKGADFELVKKSKGGSTCPETRPSSNGQRN